MSEPPRRRLRSAPVLPPPHAPDAPYGPNGQQELQQLPDGLPRYGAGPAAYPSSRPTYPPHAYQRYAGSPPPAPWAYGGWAPAPPPRPASIVSRLLLGLVGTGAVLFFALILLSTLATPPAPARSDISHEPAPAADPNAIPVSPRDALAVLQSNTLYEQGGLPNGTCPAQDLGDASTAEQTRFYESLMGCLNDEWRRPVQGAGYAYSEPGLVVFDSPVSTPCGSATPQSGRTLAFYCPSGSVMYADVPQMRQVFADVEVAYAIVIGHEFGHHVQAETGMINAFHDLTYEDFADRAEASRRLELQASCFGGLFLGAIAQSFPVDESRFAQLQQVAAAFGDDPNAAPDERDHGSGESNRAWILAGFARNDLAVCDTFLAEPGDVD